MKHLELGRKGEAIAANFLREKGFVVVEQNYRVGKAEIDLIVSKERLLVFVEVKTRSGTSFGFPESWVDDRKAELITQAAEEYLEQFPTDQLIRFDIVAILKQQQGFEIEHFEDAFY